jgi:hypothetical protein
VADAYGDGVPEVVGGREQVRVEEDVEARSGC